MKKHQEFPLPRMVWEEDDGKDLTAVWQMLDAAPDTTVSPEETDRAWTALARRLELETATDATREPRISPRSKSSTLRMVGRAAAVAALAVAGVGAWYAVPVTHVAAPGERVAVTLPDGSEVTLNAGSTLRHRRSFAFFPGISAGSRAVALSGEAFFDVTSAVRPFRVRAGTAEVRVLGTQFNVRARDEHEAGTVRVTVEEGRVEVRSTEEGRSRASTILGAGQAVQVGPEIQVLRRDEVAMERIAPWRNGGLAAVDESLASILTELGLRFGVRVTLANPEAGTSRFDAYYPSVESLESVLADLATQANLRYRQTNDGWELF